MTDAQTWTLIGVFASALFAMTTLVLRTVRAEISAKVDGLRAETTTAFGELRAEVAAGFGRMDARFGAMDGRLDSMDARLGYLDRDVQLLMRREFGDER